MVRERWIGNYLDIGNGGHAQETAALTVINPKTGSRITIPPAHFQGLERVNIEDPATGELLVVDVRSGKILSE